MFCPHKPEQREIAAFLERERGGAFTYLETGASAADTMPEGYCRDYNIRVIGRGEGCFQRARERLKTWRMFPSGWTEVYPSDAEQLPGSEVAIVIRHLGFWSINSARIVYVTDEIDDAWYEFAYGTLPGHAECGEERFSVVWNRGTDEVEYSIRAFSKPRHLLARFGFPIARFYQRAFVRDSLYSMVDSSS